MSFLYPVTPPVKLYTDSDGNPLEGGYIYFGTANQNPEVTPIAMYWDAAGTIPAAQPLRTINGYITRQGSPANIYATGDCSITVRDSNGALVMTSPVSVDIQLALAISGSTIAASIPLADAGGYFTTDNVEAAFQQIGGSGFTTFARLAAAVQALLVPTGTTVDYVGTTAPTAWVLADGKTIGSATSGGTERANTDTLDLYTLLWNAYSNTELIIEDSAGTPTTRGASASNDFAANKRLPLPDCRGRVRAGKDNMGGTTASRITVAGGLFDATVQGASGGAQNYALSTAELAAHAHGPGVHTHAGPSHTHTGPSHTHTIAHDHNNAFAPTNTFGAAGGGTTVFATPATSQLTGGSNTANSGSEGTGATGASGTGNTGAPSADDTASAGSGTAHDNVQPTIIFTAIIKL